jgi:Protein of unknown function (DUF1552)
MIVTKKALERRTFLRGMGVTLALPFLDAMVPALSRAAVTAAPIRRLGFFYIPNGVVMNKWTPAREGADFEFSPTLSALEPVKDRVLVLSGLGHNQANSFGDGNGDHSRAGSTWLSAVHPFRTEGANVRLATTLDQIAAKQFAQSTQLASLEVCIDSNHAVGNCENGYNCAYLNSISWRSPTMPNPPENNPRVLFERMFGDGGTASQRMAQLKQDFSILDGVNEEINRMQSGLGASDRRALGEYTDTIRDIERRIQKAEQQNSKITTPELDKPVGIPEKFESHLDLLFDLQVLAYQADITRVVSFMLGRELGQRTYPQIGVPDPHHSISHHQNNPEKIAKLEKIDAYHIQLLSKFLQKLKATPDGDGNLLDHSMILYGGGICDGNLHNHIPLPTLLCGGASGQLKGGRHLKYEEGTPLANLYVSMLDKLGIRADKVGDSTGGLDLDRHLTGV